MKNAREAKKITDNNQKEAVEKNKVLIDKMLLKIEDEVDKAVDKGLYFTETSFKDSEFGLEIPYPILREVIRILRTLEYNADYRLGYNDSYLFTITWRERN